MPFYLGSELFSDLQLSKDLHMSIIEGRFPEYVSSFLVSVSLFLLSIFCYLDGTLSMLIFLFVLSPKSSVDMYVDSCKNRYCVPLNSSLFFFLSFENGDDIHTHISTSQKGVHFSWFT